jgi:hypothetical protein
MKSIRSGMVVLLFLGVGTIATAQLTVGGMLKPWNEMDSVEQYEFVAGMYLGGQAMLGLLDISIESGDRRTGEIFQVMRHFYPRTEGEFAFVFFTISKFDEWLANDSTLDFRGMFLNAIKEWNELGHND